MCSKGTNLGPARGSSAGLSPSEEGPRKEAVHQQIHCIIGPKISLVISSGVSIPYDATVKNRYSYDESRDLSDS